MRFCKRKARRRLWRGSKSGDLQRRFQSLSKRFRGCCCRRECGNQCFRRLSECCYRSPLKSLAKLILVVELRCDCENSTQKFHTLALLVYILDEQRKDFVHLSIYIIVRTHYIPSAFTDRILFVLFSSSFWIQQRTF